MTHPPLSLSVKELEVLHVDRMAIPLCQLCLSERLEQKGTTLYLTHTAKIIHATFNGESSL